MLILTRKPGQVVTINLREDVDLKTPVGELFAQGSIEVMVTAVNGGQVKLGIRMSSGSDLESSGSSRRCQILNHQFSSSYSFTTLLIVV